MMVPCLREALDTRLLRGGALGDREPHGHQELAVGEVLGPVGRSQTCAQLTRRSSPDAPAKTRVLRSGMLTNVLTVMPTTRLYNSTKTLCKFMPL